MPPHAFGPIGEWKALEGRVTLFPSSSPTSSVASAHAVYQQVWGDDPDSFQKGSGVSPGVAQGKRKGMNVSCFVHPGRIDFNLAPTPEGTEMSLALISDVEAFFDSLNRIIVAVSKGVSVGSMNRVGLHVQFFRPASNFTEANRMLTEIMPDKYRLALSDEEDFGLQVNRPYVSHTVPDIKMNAIAKWSIERLQVVAFAAPVRMAGVQTQPRMPAPRIKEFMGASTAFENNNSKPTSLSPDQQSSLLFEAMAQQNIFLGDGRGTRQ